MAGLSHFNDFITLLFPNNCTICGEQIVGESTVICSFCIQAFPLTQDNPFQNSLSNRLMSLAPISFVYAMCYYNEGSGVRKAMKELKYRKAREIGYLFGRLLGESLTAFHLDLDCIVPVPLHPIRERRRGYNQAQLISSGVSEVLNLPVIDYLLVRTRYNQSQTLMHKIERFENVDQLFEVNKNQSVNGQNVLLIDDVITTGATMLSCAETLFAQGANTVGLASVAKASEI